MKLKGSSLAAEEVSESAKKIGAFIAKPGSAAVAAAEVTENPEEPSAGGPVYKKWWFWTAVGVVAVGGITAGAVAGANNSGGRPFNVVLGTP